MKMIYHFKFEGEKAKLVELDNNKEDVMNDYIESVYDSALELFKTFCEQEHSGMSANLTKHIFDKLVDGKPLTPITGEEDEWDNCIDDYGDGFLTQQNKRMPSLFRSLDKDGKLVGYTYNYIVEFINSDDVWEKYPPLDCNRTLDDEHPSVKKYFDELHKLREYHNSQIKMPLVDIKTHKYEWDFEKEEFVRTY
jgi:hypothetical protein